MLKERSQTFKLVFIFLDLGLSILSFALAFYIRYRLEPDPTIFLLSIDYFSYILLGITLGLTQVLAFLSIDLYHPRRGLSFFDEAFAILSGIFVNLMFILAILFFIRGESFSRLIIAYYSIFAPIAIAIAHYFLRKFLHHLRSRGYNLRSVIILGTGKGAQAFRDSIQRHSIYGYIVTGFLTGSKKLFKKGHTETILGSWKDLEKIIIKTKPDLVVYSFSHEEGSYLKETIDICDYYGIDLKVIPSYEEFITARGRVEVMEGIPIITIRNIPIRLGYNQVIKRIFDISFSFLFILFFSPFYLLMAALIKITSPGPIFYKQERVGLDNKKFQMLKFRTMEVQEKKDSDTKWTVENDPRVTKIGAILRKLSLDETPQFINVLIGNMSVVGPRPERPYFVDQFQIKHRHYMRRHAVKAGITGWAQIQGLRGNTSIEQRIEADIYYIENWSLYFDLKIILLTPLKGLYSKNAY
ncbi:undecaprenyl-phosphate glucose phosphotransferase [Leptospira sp. GIMC2001]|uniref:undecaprenyl-phosphate glucose phosphotransferase n=1 Tax=Leptospira sp. GIMC2001 TaxID=1513297 RepID=UPI002349A91E|nr:undecaprenyl-phosphate glucose phosphotransferase [Leptospira sp. GIMC2001]WCL48007.1 undecaprenyl-phosphate glucose phosphotransferase [Leptospira sp. GIMC2001]